MSTDVGVAATLVVILVLACVVVAGEIARQVPIRRHTRIRFSEPEEWVRADVAARLVAD